MCCAHRTLQLMHIAARCGAHCIWMLLAMANWLVNVSAGDAPRPEQDYDQWKAHLGTNADSAATCLIPSPGVAVERIRSTQPGEGWWAAMTLDPRAFAWLSRANELHC